MAPKVDELTDGEPEQVVLENARRKARAVRRSLSEGGRGATLPVLAVDTEVVIDGRALGKAADRGAARARLEALSGRTHSVLSGVVVLGAARGGDAGAEPDERDATEGGGGEGAEVSGIARSEVTFRALDAATLDRYLESGEWRDRAGAYAIQGLGSMLVDRIEGDFSNVVGLPLGLLIELLREPSVRAGDSAPEGAR